MSLFDAPSRALAPVADRDTSSDHSGLSRSSHHVENAEFEQQLGEIIRSARDVAASAEELLRELALRQQILRTGRGRLPPLVVDQGLLFLDAMRHRLMAALDGLPLR